MDPRVADEVSITDLFEQFIEASTMRNVLSIHHRILNYSDLNPCEFNIFFPKLKRAVMTNRLRKNWKAKALFSKIDKKAGHRCYSSTKTSTPLGMRTRENQNSGNQQDSQDYVDDSLSSQSGRTYNNNALQNYNCLVIGSGPAGLRTAIELQLLGASKVVIVEKRSRFSRNNVLHLWPFVIDDLKSLGAKKFYGKFCAGSIDHISIRQLQLILLKVCLMIGCDFRESCSYMGFCPDSIKQLPPITNGNTSDNKKVNISSSDNNTELGATQCHHDKLELTSSENFVKVSSSLKNSTEELESGESEPINEQNYSDEIHDASNNQSNCSRHDKSAESGEPTSTTSPVKEFNEQRSMRTENLHGVNAHFDSDHKPQETELHKYEWDIIIGADGRRNTLSKLFPRKEFRGRLAIAITANFINRQTQAETSVPEISGLSFIYNQDMFNALALDTNIQLENICYYKDDTHYFVMTAKKKSLLERGVLINDYAATQDLLSDNNVNREALLKYAKDAAYWTTGLEPLDFALNHYGTEDCAMFDFTSMYAASNACKALRTTKGGLALVALVGDSLLEPFWPTGSGCARGFLSSFDAAWMCRQWAVNRCPILDCHNSISSRSSRNRCSSNSGSRDGGPVEASTYNRMALSVMAERESIYRILAQTTSENLQQNYSHWTLNPHTRYPNLNRHLILPSQVEHLITDNESRLGNDKNKSTPGLDRGRRVKSPNTTSSKKSPKKLKSAAASPLMEAKNAKNRAKSLPKQAHNSYNSSRHDLALDDTYVEFEESYKNLADGTLPSSNNLQSLEARRARDIDECLRQRRQKNKINVVREQLIGQLRGQSLGPDKSGSPILPAGNAALFNELKRIREQQLKGGDNKPRDVNGPLSLLNSMRRCASFAERIKSFETKMSSTTTNDQESTNRKPQIDDVKNLPQFATLQELFVNNTTLRQDSDQARKSRLPVTKLSKDDWNVKCWEKRLATYKHKTAKELNGSTKSLNKAVSVDSYKPITKPKKQAEVFQDRIKEMAEKLKSTKDDNNSRDSIKSNGFKNITMDQENSYPIDGQTKGSSIRSRGWVNHLKNELTKGTVRSNRPAMNPVVPNKPIKKLFEDDDDEDDGIDINKHYDHLCVNRPTNKYLPKGAYTSHLVRTKYNSATSKVINRPHPTADSKQAYLANLTSRASSASSTLSDYSTNTAKSSSDSGKQQKSVAGIVDVECIRCQKFVSSADRITVGNSTLHRICITCANCGITLRSNEIQHYLNLLNNDAETICKERQNDVGFVCAICKPEIRDDLNREAADRLAQIEGDESTARTQQSEMLTDGSRLYSTSQNRLKSREEFFNTKINYNDIYKNILGGNEVNRNKNSNDNNDETRAIKSNWLRSGSRETTPRSSDAQEGRKSSSQDYEDAKSTKQDSEEPLLRQGSKVSPSPIQVTLPLEFVSTTNEQHDEGGSEQYGHNEEKSNYRIARSETIDDGSEQVTLILPSSGTEGAALNETLDVTNFKACQPREMMDEEELERILHLGKPTTESGTDGRRRNSTENSSDDSTQTTRKKKTTSRLERVGTTSKQNISNDRARSSGSDSSNDTSEDDGNNRNNGDEDGESLAGEEPLSDDPSSLNSPPNTDDYDDDGDDDEEDDHDDEVEDNSTYDDFVTSEEFDNTVSVKKDVDFIEGSSNNATEDEDDDDDNNDRNVNNKSSEQSPAPSRPAAAETSSKTSKIFS